MDNESIKSQGVEESQDMDKDDAKKYFQWRAYCAKELYHVSSVFNLRVEYHWARYAPLVKLVQDLKKGNNKYYIVAKSEFPSAFSKRDYPHHNGVAFWKRFMSEHSTMTEICERGNLLVFFVALCSYGDIFSHALVKSLPKTMVRPGDLCADNYDGKEFQKMQNALEEQQKWFFDEIPELKKSVIGFSSFRNLWQNHMDGAKRLLAWKEEYNKCSFRPHQHLLDSADSCDALAHLFYQYIRFSNERSNSRHVNADRAGEAYGCGSDEVLYNTMHDLAAFLKTDGTVAKVAPVYTLLFFVKNAERLCKTAERDGMNAEERKDDKRRVCKAVLKTSDLTKDTEKSVKVYIKDQAPSNIKNPKKAWVLTYQLLCSYFDKNPEQLKVEYDPALCEYILQGKCALTGQTYYNMRAIDTILGGILDEERWVCTSDFEESDKPLHPLLCEIQKRLNWQLYVYPRDGNIICEEPPGRNDDLYDVAIAKKREMIVDKYSEICVLSQNGIGSNHFAESLKEQYAEFLDELAKTINAHFDDDNLEIKPAAFERSVCKIGAQGVFDKSFKEVTTYLYRILYSEDVASCKDVVRGLS